MKVSGIGLILMFMLNNLHAQIGSDRLPLVPLPNQIKTMEGHFDLSAKTLLKYPSDLEMEATHFGLNLMIRYGIKMQFEQKNKSKNQIELRLNSMLDPMEGAYHLVVNKNKILIESSSKAGVFYGLQSLIQLLPLNGKNKLQIPILEINDKPRYAWRGMHLDCSRHFFPASFVMKYIELLALYKMNVFHWHLTDDQGWRIEIKQYPKLTEIGAWRKGSMVGHYRDQQFDSIRYGGFYTQEEIKYIVAFAESQHVTIVPEIEMPGHAVAALAAYPEYSCSKRPVEVSMRWGVEENVFCVTEETFTFLGNILKEVMNLFPGKYIHIGGDEVLKDEWNKSDVCRAIMKQENLKDAHELQSYFIKRIEKIVNENGRAIIGWDEILEGGLAPNAAVMSWRGIEGGIAAARQKHKVVMTPGSHCYFDHYQGEAKDEPLAIGGFTNLEKVYSYEPTPDSLTEEEGNYILGAQGNVWTEYIDTQEKVEYMAMPRLAALSEVLWLDKNKKDYTDFYARMKLQIPFLKRRNINFSRSTLHPSLVK
ncbi:MAG: beta-N-acetylhexosaminidase [bacterium]|nr:beta-N-acetylhexosaminidase [bacterium]